MEADYAIPGLLLDAQNDFVLAAFSDDTLGVFVGRLTAIPTKKEVQSLCERGLWVVLKRNKGDDLQIFDPEYDGGFYEFTTPQERESVVIAKALALHVWPEWCPHLRSEMTPRTDFMVLTGETIEA